MDFGKEIRALSSLFVHLLESQGFITVPAGEQGEEITQTPGDRTKANGESLRARAAKEQPRGSQARNPGTVENHKKDNGSHEAFQASRPS